MEPNGTDCARALEWASLELDDGLSQVERALLAAHVRACAPCASQVEATRAVTQMIRSAPLERPATSFAVPASRPRRHARGRALRIAAAGALVGVTAAAGVLVGLLQQPAEPTGRTPPTLAYVPPKPNVDRELRDLKRHYVRPYSDEPRAGRVAGI